MKLRLQAAAKKPVAKIAAAPVRRSPRGKGVFVRMIEGAGGVEHIVARARWAGLSWVCAQVYWKGTYSDPDHGTNLNAEHLHDLQAALKPHGIVLWLWGWPVPDRLDEFANVIESGTAGLPYAGLILDVEGNEWFDQHIAALVLMDAMPDVIGGRPLGVTSYGYPPNFQTMPWGALNHADFGVPQVYHGHDVYGPDYQAAAMGEWDALGFDTLAPALAAYDLTAAEMTEIYARTPKPDDAVIWWDFYNLEQNPELWWAVKAAGTKDWGSMGLSA